MKVMVMEVKTAGAIDTGVDNQENETGEEVKLSTAKVKQELNPQITATLNKSNIKENEHKQKTTETLTRA